MNHSPITISQAAELLVLHENLLIRPELSVSFEPSRAWTMAFPPAAGVYAVFKGSSTVYIGESGNIRGRMSDLKQTVNHTLRRTIGNELFVKHPLFKPATSRHRFADELESKLNQWMKEHLSVWYSPIAFGRAEIEEHLIAKLKPIYNKKQARKT